MTRMLGSVPEERLRDPARLAEMSPEHVGRVVAAIADESTDWLNGRVIGSMGTKVSLYSNPTPLAELVTDGAWDLASLRDEMDTRFKPVVADSVAPAGA